jgi:hypothetical protein
MTANELADKLMESNSVAWGSCTHEQHDNDKYFKEQAATMLRQQQAEIESLGKAFEGERKYARYLSELCIDNKIPIVWSF